MSASWWSCVNIQNRLCLFSQLIRAAPLSSCVYHESVSFSTVLFSVSLLFPQLDTSRDLQFALRFGLDI